MIRHRNVPDNGHQHQSPKDQETDHPDDPLVTFPSEVLEEGDPDQQTGDGARNVCGIADGGGCSADNVDIVDVDDDVGEGDNADDQDSAPGTGHFSKGNTRNMKI